MSERIRLDLPREHVQIILNALGEMPTKIGMPVVQAIFAQVNPPPPPMTAADQTKAAAEAYADPDLAAQAAAAASKALLNGHGG